MHVCLPSFAFLCYCARWQSGGHLVRLSEVASVLKCSAGKGAGGRGKRKGCCSKVEPKNNASQGSFAVLAFLLLTLGTCASCTVRGYFMLSGLFLMSKKMLT